VREAVAKLLGAQARVFVTKCVQAELQSLGSDYAGAPPASLSSPPHALADALPHSRAHALTRTATAALARRLDGLAGGLAPPASAADSLAAAVGPANAEHFFVATQDEALRERLRKARTEPKAASSSSEALKLHRRRLMAPPSYPSGAGSPSALRGCHGHRAGDPFGGATVGSGAFRRKHLGP